jgi:histidyl-tRNA synthetase
MTILKTPKGTKDFNQDDMILREHILFIITTIFKKYGGIAIDTPVFELKENLTDKYGNEASKLIYDLQNQGGELLSLRYDLTVPFARYLAMNKHINFIKRYQIGKVYRRDQPAISKGRFREFLQCDFDIAGSNLIHMFPDAEIIKILYDILIKLDIGLFIIKINHRSLLEGIFEISNIEQSLFKTVCSSIDKLDKLSWDFVFNELLTKGIEANSASLIYKYINTDINLLPHNDKIKIALNDINKLNEYLDIFNIKTSIKLDLSLARGLDYYTGIIIEAVLIDNNIGSIAGGGRYDNLINNIPCVGISIGFERIFTILYNKKKYIDNFTKIYIISSDIYKRISLLNKLRDLDINADISYKSSKINIVNEFEYCEKKNIPFALIFNNDIMKIRNIKTRIETIINNIDNINELLIN